jgi:RND superfamily putative drug exporter
LVALAQIGFAVAFGVLLDTLVVRSILVPALVHLLGPKIWWPAKNIK